MQVRFEKQFETASWASERWPNRLHVKNPPVPVMCISSQDIDHAPVEYWSLRMQSEYIL